MPNKLQIKKKLKLLFSRPGGRSKSKKSTDQSLQEPVILRYRSNEVTMEVFMECICDNNFAGLVASGNPTSTQIAEAWASLFYEYCDIMEMQEVRYRARLHTEIILTRRKIQYAEVWVRYLEVIYNRIFAEALQKIGFEYDLDPSDPDQYRSDINRIIAELRSIRLKLRAKESEYDTLVNKKTSEASPVDRKHFYSNFDNINDLRKWGAITEKSSVMQYAIALSRMNQYYERLNKQIHAR